MMFHWFWTQSDNDWSLKSNNSGSYEVRSEMKWMMVYCIALAIGFHSKPTKWLLPPYYDVPQVLDSIRYRLVHEIGQFKFVGSSFWNWVVGVSHSSIDWISLKTHQVLDIIPYGLVHEIGQFRFVRSSLWSGVVGVLHGFSNWISLKIHQMTPPTILRCSPSFGLDPMSIGPQNRIIQVLRKFVLKWIGCCIALFYRLNFT